MSIQQWVTPLEGLDSLRQTEAPMVSPGSGEVLVEVRAVSLNYRDVEGLFKLVEFFPGHFRSMES
jgi:NADPH:quinone reductase-like Zn-dependent oxidoreductase